MTGATSNALQREGKAMIAKGGVSGAESAIWVAARDTAVARSLRDGHA